MGFPKQENWSGLPFPPPGDLPLSGTERLSTVVPALAGGFFTPEPPGKPHIGLYVTHKKGDFLRSKLVEVMEFQLS